MSSALYIDPTHCRSFSDSAFRFVKFLRVIACLVAIPGIAQAFENLTPAQNLVYGTAHLSNTVAGQHISYRYHSRTGADDVIDDRAVLSIEKSHGNEKRDVALDFLSEERHLPLPDFTAFRGNPVIIAMLEHVAQSFGQETGGSVLYFRNRIRDALANENNRIEQVTVAYHDETVEALRIVFSPFTSDVYLAEKPEYTSAAFSITLSDSVPGGVVRVAVLSRQNDVFYFEREIVIE